MVHCPLSHRITWIVKTLWIPHSPLNIYILGLYLCWVKHSAESREVKKVSGSESEFVKETVNVSTFKPLTCPTLWFMTWKLEHENEWTLNFVYLIQRPNKPNLIPKFLEFNRWFWYLFDLQTNSFSFYHLIFSVFFAQRILFTEDETMMNFFTSLEVSKGKEQREEAGLRKI